MHFSPLDRLTYFMNLGLILRTVTAPTPPLPDWFTWTMHEPILASTSRFPGFVFTFNSCFRCERPSIWTSHALALCLERAGVIAMLAEVRPDFRTQRSRLQARRRRRSSRLSFVVTQQQFPSPAMRVEWRRNQLGRCALIL